MLLRRIKNRIYLLVKKWQLNQSYRDVNASVHPSVMLERVELHGKVTIEEKCKIHQAVLSGPIHIGRYTSLWGPNIQVLAHNNPITIGNFCSIARDVTIQEYFHDHSKLTTYFIGRNVFGQPIEHEVVSKGPISIGHDVWIGTGVQVMSGVTVGNGAVIAANSTVTKDVPPYAIVAGAPAKVIKFRFEQEKIDLVEKMKWWDWAEDELREQQSIFK
jgi:virginiamycin A acetyltransferase